MDTYQAFYDILQLENFELDNFPKTLGDVEEVKEWIKYEWFEVEDPQNNGVNFHSELDS